MRISDIRNIIVISEIKNFNKASAYLHISQPALSQSVKRLEESLGSQLFIRNKKTVSLSAAGEEFIKEGSKILQIYDRMIMNIGHNQEKNEPIRIAASSVYARRYFPEIFKTFRSLHPEVELKMVEMQNKSRLQSLLELPTCRRPSKRRYFARWRKWSCLEEAAASARFQRHRRRISVRRALPSSVSGFRIFPSGAAAS